MEKDEKIKVKFSRYTNMVNYLKSLEKAYPNGDLVNEVFG